MTVKELKEILDEIEDPYTDITIEHNVRGIEYGTKYEVSSYYIWYSEMSDISDDLTICFTTDYKLVPKMD